MTSYGPARRRKLCSRSWTGRPGRGSFAVDVTLADEPSAMTEGVILYGLEERSEGSVATVTIANPERLNILSSPILAELEACLRRAGELEDLRVLVLQGGGERAFIGGADIRELAVLEPDSARAFITSVHRVCTAPSRAACACDRKDIRLLPRCRTRSGGFVRSARCRRALPVRHARGAARSPFGGRGGSLAAPHRLGAHS